MPADKSQPVRRTLQPACDACHVRRVKCSHDQPCAHCSRLGLTCTYTKAHTAKKTAGKRIEALRQAERSRQVYPGKRDDDWTPPLPGVPGGSGWSGAPGGIGSTYGGHADVLHEPRFPPQPSTDSVERPMHHFYTNVPASSSPMGVAPLSSNSAQPGPSSVWGPSSSPRNRTSLPYDTERQVRFQAPSVSSASVHRPHYGSTSYGLAEHEQQPVTGMGPGSIGPSANQSGMSAYQDDMASEAHYLPSPAQFFPHPGPRPNFGQSGGMMSGAEASNPTSAIPFDTQMPSTDYLQSSVLPPFSTSMADSLFNQQGVFNADSLFNEGSLPPLVTAGHGQQTVLDMLGACLPSGETPGSVDSSVSAMDNFQSAFGEKRADGRGQEAMNGKADEQETENHPLSDSVLIPTLALFYERLGGVMPVFSRSWIFARLDRDEHQSDPHFASMLIAMSALTIIQAQPNTETRDKRADRISARRRRAKATRLLEEALKLREGPSMGQNPSLEMCCTSFFIFATLFGLGEHSAAWYRLRESITLAHLCRLHEPSAYEGLPKDEAERRLRAYWLLAITERAFAIQRGMPLMLTGNPRASTASLRAKLGFKELSDFPDLQLRLFDHVDEKFVDCWNRKCQGPGCPNFDAERAINLWRSFTDGINQPGSRERSVTGEERDEEEPGAGMGMGMSSSSGAPRSSMLPSAPVHRRQIQRADVEVTRHWLLNRLWLITLNHGLLSIDAKDPPLRVDHAIHVAQSVFDVCDSLSLSAMEAHGVGFTYKLYDIAQTLVLLCKDEMIAEAISKGGVGEQLEKQTTAAHTSGRSHVDRTTSKTSPRSVAEPKTESHIYSHLYGDPYDALFTNATRGPASLRRTVLGILNEYLTLFQKFRGGDHPYLDKLLELIDELKADMDPTATASVPEAASHIVANLGAVGHRSTDDVPTTMPDSSIDTTASRNSLSVEHLAP